MAKVDVTITNAVIDHDKDCVVFTGEFVYSVPNKKIDKVIAKKIAKRNRTKDTQIIGGPH